MGCNMKRFPKISIIAAIAAVFACSCTKEGPDRFKGYYSFSASGSISCREQGNADAEMIQVRLPDEIGQMDILKTDNDGNMYVTMRVLSGPVVVFEARAEGQGMTLSPTERIITIRHDIPNWTITADVSGTGHKYDDSVIFDLTYEGSCKANGTMYDIVGSNVKCVAKMN